MALYLASMIFLSVKISQCFRESAKNSLLIAICIKPHRRNWVVSEERGLDHKWERSGVPLVDNNASSHWPIVKIKPNKTTFGPLSACNLENDTSVCYLYFF